MDGKAKQAFIQEKVFFLVTLEGFVFISPLKQKRQRTCRGRTK